MSLTKKQLNHLEMRLLDERKRALKALGLFDRRTKADRESGDSDLAAYTDHMADQGTEAMEREKAAIFASKRPSADSTTIPRTSGSATRVDLKWV